MKNLSLSFKQDSKNYQVLIGQDLLSKPQVFLDVISGETVLIVTNETIAPLYLTTLESNLSSKRVLTFQLPDGEAYKNRENFNLLLDFMIDSQLKRNDTVIALGGGVVGDLVGYASSSYFRGINFIQAPTSLLAQVDSSVGGKTAINHPKGKNLLGAFYQPLRVVTDISTLKTLPQREFQSGIAEIIKIAMICDSSFFEWLENKTSDILAQDEASLIQMIEWACRLKSQVVINDEQEQGLRATLNLGHTFGHAIEHKLGYGTLLHGEAVSIGIYWACLLSEKLYLLKNDEVNRVKALLQAFDLPISLPPTFTVNADNICSLGLAMKLDKKNHNKNIKFILPQGIGKVIFNDQFDATDIQQYLLEFAQSEL